MRGRGGGSYNYVQHSRPIFNGNISVDDSMPLSSLLKTSKIAAAASNAGGVSKNRDSRRIAGFVIYHCWIVTYDKHLNNPV